ncbi:exosortase family protein XrtF [Flavobacterium zepuense]|uniref:Exosortase family protein XrtF n=1 Tax=Flavobacterium zepuense TaxID=2593302 RepID=A0A552V420_9FLAO|nr:exosortase family protein XrtF [Flavobacterium zepuense]TRW25230.1 exosortase family protein XrtF [Flavobacterium zepuense]
MGILQKNRTFFLFLLKFGLSYLILYGFYWLFLSHYDATLPEPDGMTTLVTEQSAQVLRFFGEDVLILNNTKLPSYFFVINGKKLAHIVEGCNAVSVMILFAAFIVAFSTTFKRTALYIIAGIIIIHILNIIRIALLTLGIYHYRQYTDFLHDILFPLFIYGVVFVLWVAWVIKFKSNEKAQN